MLTLVDGGMRIGEPAGRSNRGGHPFYCWRRDHGVVEHAVVKQSNGGGSNWRREPIRDACTVNSYNTVGLSGYLVKS